MVPIVFGPHIDDVKAIAPPNSFIHAEQFETAADLVTYLDYLDKNDTAYLEYHLWRNLYPPGEFKSFGTFFRLGTEERTYCELCRLIRDKREQNIHQYYKSVMKFWRYDVYPECKENATFPTYQKTIQQNLVQFKL